MKGKNIHHSIISILIICLLVSFVQKATAGDSSRWQAIGFSKDGSFFAFERYGTYDGSAFPYSEIFILNVCKNDYAVKPIRFTLEEDGGSEDDARAANMKKAKPFFDQYGIVKGNNGMKVFSGASESKPRNIFQYENKPMELLLDQKETGNCTGEVQPEKKMTLTLIYKGVTQVLQKDTQVPKSRTCAFDYSLNEAYCYSNTIVAIVAYLEPGYEGPSSRQIAVSGCFK